VGGSSPLADMQQPSEANQTFTDDTGYGGFALIITKPTVLYVTRAGCCLTQAGWVLAKRVVGSSTCEGGDLTLFSC